MEGNCAPASIPPKDTVTGLLAMLMLGSAGGLSLGLAPIIASGLTRFSGLTIVEAGQCISVEMAGSVVGAICAILLTQHVERRIAAAAALLLIIAGNFASLEMASFIGLLAARCAAGIGCGLTSIAFGMLAGTRFPTRNFALYSVTAVTSVAVAGTTISWFSRVAGADAIFWTVIAVCALTLVISIQIPIAKWETARGASGPSALPLRLARISAAGICGVIMILSYFTAISAFWTYVEEVGTSHGIEPTLISKTISGGFLVAGITGSLAASATEKYVSRGAMIITCTITTAVLIGLVLLVPYPVVYAGAVPLTVLAWFTIYPFMLGLLADTDPSGRLAMIGILAEMVGFVIGPLLFGSLVHHRYYVTSVVLSGACLSATLMCSAIVQMGVASKCRPGFERRIPI